MEEREELAALIAEEDFLMAEIYEKERQNEIENAKMKIKEQAADDFTVEVLSIPVVNDFTGGIVVGEEDATNLEVEEQVEDSIFGKTEAGNGVHEIVIQNSKPDFSLHEYSPKSVKSLKPIFSRLSVPALKTEVIENKIETKIETIQSFALVTEGYEVKSTENDDVWNLDLLACSPMPTVSDIYFLSYSY